MAFGYNFVLPAVGAYMAYRYAKKKYRVSGKQRLRGPEHPTKHAIKAAIHSLKTSQADYKKLGNLRGANAKLAAYYNVKPVSLVTAKPKSVSSKRQINKVFRRSKHIMKTYLPRWKS